MKKKHGEFFMARVLVVDDHDIVRKTLGKLIRLLGHEVVAEAQNGMFCFCEYMKHHPDIVTMDFNMPVMNGLEATRKLLQVFPEANVIMVTSEGTQKNVQEAIRAGAKNYIVKPINKEKIIRAFHSVLGNDPDEEDK